MSTQPETFDLERFESHLEDLYSQGGAGEGDLQVYFEAGPSAVSKEDFSLVEDDDGIYYQINCAFQKATDEERIALARTILETWFDTRVDVAFAICDELQDYTNRPLLFFVTKDKAELSVWCAIPPLRKGGVNYDAAGKPPLLRVLCPAGSAEEVFGQLLGGWNTTLYERFKTSDGGTIFWPRS